MRVNSSAHAETGRAKALSLSGDIVTYTGDGSSPIQVLLQDCVPTGKTHSSSAVWYTGRMTFEDNFCVTGNAEVKDGSSTRFLPTISGCSTLSNGMPIPEQQWSFTQGASGEIFFVRATLLSTRRSHVQRHFLIYSLGMTVCPAVMVAREV